MNNKDIEEDIKILKNITRQDFNNPIGWTEYYNSELKELQQAIENILGDRERLKKENEIYKEEYCKITKALDFKEGALNPEPSIAIESRRVFGKREMLWNIQRQIYGAKQKGKTINEELIIKILNTIEKLQEVEEDNWNMEKYINSEIERDVIKESRLIHEGISRKGGIA